jgi:hypothetical protein
MTVWLLTGPKRCSAFYAGCVIIVWIIMKHMFRTILSVIGMIICFWAGCFLPLHLRFIGVRYFQPETATMAILLFVFAVTLRIKFRWSLIDFLSGLLAAEVITLLLISFFNGYGIFHYDNLLWFFNLSMFIAPPWIAGLLLGNLWLNGMSLKPEGIRSNARDCASMRIKEQKIKDIDVIEKIKSAFPVKVTTEKGIMIEFEGVEEKFNLDTAHDEFTIYTDTWHYHFADMDMLLTFFKDIFAGTLQIVVKFRGKTPVAHQVQLVKDGKVYVVSQTGILIPLFWRKKSYKTLNYKITAND